VSGGLVVIAALLLDWIRPGYLEGHVMICLVLLINLINFFCMTEKTSASRRTVLSSALGSAAAIGTGILLNQRKTTSDQCKLTSYLPNVNWTMTSFLGKTLEGKSLLYDVPMRISRRLRELTNEKFNVKVDYTRFEKPTQDILEEVSDRIYECGFSGIYYSKDYFPLYFGCAIPFGLSPYEQTAWLKHKTDNSEETFIQKLYVKLKLNIIPFPAAATGGQMGGWFRREITSPSSLKDIRMRIPGLGATVLERIFGVKLHQDVYYDSKSRDTSLTISTIAQGLKKGGTNNRRALDAAEWIGPYDDVRLDLHNVGANFYYWPGWWEPSTTFDVQVNREAWKDLPVEYKAIFKYVCNETYDTTLSEYTMNNVKTLDKLKSQQYGKINLMPFPEEILNMARQGTEELLREYSEKSLFGEVYNEWMKFRYTYRTWQRFTGLSS
jgi:TRAP-type mannitol/chloroaromatic compound transport system substrate-binding protein